MAAIPIVRYLLEYSEQLPLSVLTRLVSIRDLLSLLLPLPASRPWLRRVDSGWRVFAQGAWQCLPKGSPGPQPPDVQLWLALHHLLLDPNARPKLGLDVSTTRLDHTLQLRCHMNEVLLTKVPPLRQLQRFLEELALGGGCAAPGAPLALVVEHIQTLWEGLCCSLKSDWEAIAKTQTTGHLCAAHAAAQRASQVAAMAAQFDALCGVVDLQEGPVCCEQHQKHYWICFSMQCLLPIFYWPGGTDHWRRSCQTPYQPAPAGRAGACVPCAAHSSGWVGTLGILLPAG